MFYLWTGSSSGFAPSMYQSLDYLLDAYPLSHGCHRQVRSRLLLRNIKGIRIDRERERDRFRYISKKPTCVAAPSPRASLGRRTVCGRTEQRRPPVLKRYETKVRMVWGSFLIAAAARKTPTRNCYNAQGVNLTFHPPPPPPPPPPPRPPDAPRRPPPPTPRCSDGRDGHVRPRLCRPRLCLLSRRKGSLATRLDPNGSSGSPSGSPQPATRCDYQHSQCYLTPASPATSTEATATIATAATAAYNQYRRGASRPRILGGGGRGKG